jgi:polyisoprenoid-binding protein YceI
VFVGNIKNPADIKLNADGVYKVQVSGSLTLHGVTNPQNAEAVFTVKGGAISAVSALDVTVADYKIKIPALVADHIGKTVKVVVNVPSYESR